MENIVSNKYKNSKVSFVYKLTKRSNRRKYTRQLNKMMFSLSSQADTDNQKGKVPVIKEVQKLTEEMLKKDLNVAINEARAILTDDTVYLVMNQRFFAALAVEMKKNITTDVPYAAVNIINSIMQLYINPLTYPKLPKRERIGILIHEILHLALEHVTRYNDLPDDEKNHYYWNLATDCAINQLVPNNASIGLPDWVYFPETFKKYGIDMPPNLSADEYYNILLANKEKVPDDLNSGGGSNGNGDGESSDGKSGDSSNNPSQNEGANNPSQNGGTKGQAKHENWHKKWKESEGSRKMNEAAVKNALTKAFTREAGSVPGNLKRHILDIIESKVPWYKMFEQMWAKYLRGNVVRTPKRESRRLGELAKGRRTKPKLSVVVIADTSMSITGENLSQYTGQIVKIWKSGVKITVIEADAAITDVYEFKGKINRVQYEGGGGTSFIPPFEHILKKRMDADLVIYLTDGYGKAPDKFPIPTIWCLTPGGKRPDAASGGQVKWGKVIEMN